MIMVCGLTASGRSIVHSDAAMKAVMAHLYEDDWGAIKALGDSADLGGIVVPLHLVLHSLHTPSEDLIQCSCFMHYS